MYGLQEKTGGRMMLSSIDEVIAKYKDIANTDANCPRHCMRPCDECVQECKQVLEWLEELKTIKSDGFTDDLLNMGFTKGYNKAIDDFVTMCDEVKVCETYDCVSLYEIEHIAEQLKAGGENEV